MSDYYFHEDTKKIYMLLDDEVCFMWEDREKDLFFADQFFPILDVVKQVIFIIDGDEFEDKFILIDTNNFDEIQDMYGFDELTKQKIKKEMLQIENQ
jgi:hypothetical protein